MSKSLIMSAQTPCFCFVSECALRVVCAWGMFLRAGSSYQLFNKKSAVFTRMILVWGTLCLQKVAFNVTIHLLTQKDAEAQNRNYSAVPQMLGIGL
ncbi:MAG: hypothetical protein KKD63_00340, partial [Proteobacteria bacterium]|nr:hypothetical protein [Pseudomonadota bacterium]